MILHFFSVANCKNKKCPVYYMTNIKKLSILPKGLIFTQHNQVVLLPGQTESKNPNGDKTKKNDNMFSYLQIGSSVQTYNRIFLTQPNVWHC